ncbi:site-specific integrase [Chryseobacterium nematophagum]|uniref:Site-specific integrase n=1 Tax=Chryseobacterium nematophagum TaxID=2305228 RepID=A0A3M7LEW6_9FLAO|nr:site-specific integrase [Chryseobacterium nematophagum]RMZ60032.1 site-specific integrase [Chryseobacterium nematophagum]
MENLKNLLSNGCSYSDLFVFPDIKKMSAKEAMQKTWFVECVFYDPLEQNRYPKGYVWRKKKLAKFKTFQERLAAAKILKIEMERALQNGFNPMPQVKAFKITNDSEYSANMYLLEALDLAFENHKKNIGYEHSQVVKSTLNKMRSVFIELGYDNIKIKDVELKHIHLTLEKCKLTAYSFNKYRVHLSTLFAELCANSCLVQNPCQYIKRKKHIKKEVKILSKDKFATIYEFLLKEHCGFANYAQIFHMSGCRSSELLEIKKSDVDIDNQEFTIVVKKRQNYTREKRAIIPDAIPFWKKQLDLCIHDNDYLFGIGFYPELRDKAITYGSSHVYWKRYVKNKFEIEENFYSLKHFFLDMIDEKYGIQTAQELAGHLHSRTSEIYTIKKEKRKLEGLKKIKLN